MCNLGKGSVDIKCNKIHILKFLDQIAKEREKKNLVGLSAE